jgi:hypothetical protein
MSDAAVLAAAEAARSGEADPRNKYPSATPSSRQNTAIP